MPSPRPIDFLRDAIDAARAALRDLDADQVPARVRRIRSSSERSLPPPLAVSLLRELAADEFLREKALEAWDGDRPPAAGPALASYLFLSREDGWEGVVVTEALALGERHGAASDRSGEVERATLAAEVASLKEQLKRSRKEAGAVERELRQALDAERAPVRADRASEQRLRERLDEVEAARIAAEAEADARIGDLDAEVRRLKEEVRSVRADRAGLAAQVEAGAIGGIPTDPAGFAKLLDDLVATAMAMAPAAEVEMGRPAAEGTLPPFDASVRPDAAEAIDWLVGAGAATVLIDGYNLGFALAGLEAERARAVAIEAGGRLGAAAPALAVTVVFDSSIEPVAANQSSGNRLGAAVVFTEGEIADDAIVERACAGTKVVVVTNDRDLRQRAEACGALTLWSDALVEWSRRR